MFDTRTGDLVTLNQVRRQIIGGKSIRVLQSQTDEDVTQKILLRVISLESGVLGNSVSLSGELEALIRRKARKNVKPGIRDDSSLDDVELAKFMRLQAGYLDVWAKDFGRRFCSLEHMLCVNSALRYHWSGRTIELETAIRSMKHGAPKTRMSRVGSLIDKGWLRKIPDRIDKRKVVVLPTSEFEELIQSYSTRTLTNALHGVPDSVGLNSKVSSIVGKIQKGKPETIRRRYLVPYLEYVVWALESWDTLMYGHESLKSAFIVICTHTVVSELIDKPLTAEKLRELSPLISARVLKARIDQCIESKLIVKSKHPEDNRMVVFAPTRLLKKHLKTHYSQLFWQFIHLVENLP